MKALVMAGALLAWSGPSYAAAPTLEDLRAGDWAAELPSPKAVVGPSAPAGAGAPVPAAKPAEPAKPPVAAEEYPQLKACEAAIQKSINWSKAVCRDDKNQPYKGYAAASYGHSEPMTVSLVLLTDSAAYYYYESCDICADVDRCDLKTHEVTKARSGHSVSCGDMAPFVRGAVAYDACKAPSAASAGCSRP